jgi:hypothetical protein
MSSKSTRFLSFPRFSKTNLQKVLSAKAMRRASAEKHGYDSLEPRQLLTADIGLNFTSADDDSGNPPNISAAVGENHIVQFTNNSYSIFNKADGSPANGGLTADSGSLNQFFIDAGTDPGDDITLSQPRLVFDSGFDRWYVIAVDNQDLNDDLPLVQGNRMFIAASNTPDPTASWKSSTIQLDTGSFDADGNIVFLFGTERINLSVDEVGLSISAQEFTFTLFGKTPVGTAAVGLPQVALFGGAIETNRLEGLRGVSNNDIGFEIQYGLDTTIDPQTFPVTFSQSVFSLAIDGEGDGDTFPAGRQGDELILTEFTRDGTPNVNLNFAQGVSKRIPIDFYREPDVVRQPTDIIRDRDSTLFNASVAQEGRYLYAVHSVRDVITLADGTQAEGPNAVLRWYKVDTQPEIDPVTGDEILLVDFGVIRAATDDIDYIDPSIDVSPNGTVAIGYTATGLSLFPSSFASIGVPSAGVDSPIVFNDPTELRLGESQYIDVGNHFWGRYTTTVNDPYDPNNFWTFQQYTNANNEWAIQTTQFGPSNSNPTIDITPVDLDNVIEINQVGDNIEVVVDGVITGVYDSDGIGLLTVNGNGGFDQFIVNIDDLDAAAIVGTYNLVGDGDDTLQLNVSSDTVWQFDGANGVNINSGRILGTGMVEFTSGSGNDRFQFPTSNYNFPVFAGTGNDVFVVEQNVTGNLQLFGQAGDDVYNLPATSFAGVAIQDSVGSENDQLTSTGTDGQDIINVGENLITINGETVPFDQASTAWGIETFAIDAMADDDTFNITSTTRGFALFGKRGDDVFNVDETSVMTGAATLFIDGGEGDNSLNVSQNDALGIVLAVADNDLITSMTSAEINFVAVGGTFAETATSTGITLLGSETRGDIIAIIGVEAGNDLKALGRALDDRFIFETTIDGTAELLGGAGNDRYETNSIAIFDVVVTDSVDSEMDTFYVRMTVGDDVIDVTTTGFAFNGVTYPTADASFSGIEDFALDGADGNDTFNIDRTTTVASFDGSAGNDVFNVTDLIASVGETEIDIDGGTGTNELNVARNQFTGSQAIVNETTIVGMTIATINYGQISLLNLTGSKDADDFVVETLLPSTLLRINAGDGDDTMLVRRAVLGDVDLTGGGGDDVYRVEVQGDKSRLVQVFDPAVNLGDDRAEVVYTPAAETITLDGSVVGLGSDVVDIDQNVEVLALEALGGDDRFNIIGPVHARVELFGQAGDDIYHIQDLAALSSEIAIFDSVGAENDTLLVTGTVNADEFIIDEDSITINGVALTEPGGGSIIGVEGFTFDGAGADDIFRINSTTLGYTYLGSDGNDQFFITDTTVTTGVSSFLIDGGTGNNEMFVSRSAILGGAAAGTEIVIEDNVIVGATIADINYRATDGIFSLIEMTGTSGTTAGDDVYNDVFRVNTLNEETLLDIKSLGGDDIIDVRAAAAGDVAIDGGLGDDSFLVALGGGVDRVVTVDDSGVNTGFDRLDVFFSDADETINVIDSLGNRITYAVGNSSVDFDPNLESLALHALGGDDRYVVTGTTTDELILAGGEGDDTYDIANVFGDTAVTIIDSVNAENDRLTVSGTNDGDTFEINENSFLINGNVVITADPDNSNIVGIESLEIDGLDGDDTFIVNSATRGFSLLGGAGNDQFLINDTAADSGGGDLVIDGGTGANTMDIQRISGQPAFAVVQETYIQNVAKSTIRYSATGGSFTGGNGGITIRGLDDVNDAYLVFGLLAENSLELLGAGGNDYHRITEDVQGDVWMDGAQGRDRYVFFLDEDKSRNLRVEDSGDAGDIDRINTFLGENSDNIVLEGTEVALMNDTVSFLPTIETFEILAGDGDDRIEVRQFDGVRFLSIKGESGNDVLTISRAGGVENIFLFGEDGNDTFDLQGASEVGFVRTLGNDGDDFFRVGEDFYRNTDINGGAGDDRYDISFADRGRRSLTLADAAGVDSAIVRATDVTTRLTLRASGINSPFQLIGTTRQIDSLELIGTEGRDIVTMFAAPVVDMTINTLTGSDILNINSNNGAENLNIDLGAEQDVANIVSTAPGTTTTLDLGRDDDLVNLGSSLAADSGDLDRLQGALNIEFGQGSDRFYLNDSQSTGAHGYSLTGAQVSNDASVRNRNFSGVSYSGAEFLQVRGNAQLNQFTVSPSASVRYLLDGNLPQVNQLTITGSNDGRQLFTNGEFAGIWAFDTFRDVQFQQFAI